MMVIPAYLYHDRKMHDVVIIGELLAVAAIVMALMFVVADLGRPDRFWHMIPGIGKFKFPMSMLTWDVIVLNGYLVLKLHICGYLLYMRFLGRKPNPVWYIPFVMLSIVWAISIHTVTAFLYCGLEQPITTLTKIVRVTILINLLMVASEWFTAFYTGGTHAGAAQYLFFGVHGKTGLVAWTWTAIGLNVVAAALFLWPQVLSPKYRWALIAACVMAFAGTWIEKGMGLIVPGFIPSTLHEIVEYLPSQLEWKLTIGVWAFGLMVFTIALKTAIATLTRSSDGSTP